MAEFEIPCESREKSQVLLRLNQWLLERYRAGETAVLIVDEAQNLTPEVLEEIRLLTNLETSTEKLLQIVLTGQPELEQKLKMPELRQLRQRITMRCHTAPLSLEETFGYIAERLRIAGANGEPIFSKEAIEAVHTFSQGIPRVVNLLCEHSMVNSYVDSLRPVPAHLVEEVAREFQLDETEPIAPAAFLKYWRKQVSRYGGFARKSGRVTRAIAPGNCRAVPRKEIMSRIHEALKKAEQERAGVQVTDAGPYRAGHDWKWTTTGNVPTRPATFSTNPEDRLSAAATVSPAVGRVSAIR